MTWVGTAIVGGVGLVKGGVDSYQNKKAQQKHDAYRKVAIEMSPWTGMGDPGAGEFGNTNMLSGMLGGASQGAAIGGALGKAGTFGGGGSAGAMGSAPISAATAPSKQLQSIYNPAGTVAQPGSGMGMGTSLINHANKFNNPWG